MAIPRNITVRINKLKGQQTAYLSSGKYEHVARHIDEDCEFIVHTYITPATKDNIGYQIVAYALDLGTWWSYSFAIGPEAASRTWDWKELPDES